MLEQQDRGGRRQFNSNHDAFRAGGDLDVDVRILNQPGRLQREGRFEVAEISTLRSLRVNLWEHREGDIGRGAMLRF